MSGEIKFGFGDKVVDTGEFLGRPAVFIAPAKKPGDVGASAKRENNPPDRLVSGEYVLTFPTREQAEFVADAIVGSPGPSPAFIKNRRFIVGLVAGSLFATVLILGWQYEHDRERCGWATYPSIKCGDFK